MREIISFDEIDEYGPQSYSGTFDMSAGELDRLELASVGPVRIEARAEKGNLPGEYFIDGNATFTADFHCARCLEPYPFATSSTFHIAFRPRPEVSQEEEEIEITAPDELDVEFYSDRYVPLGDLAFEQVQLSIPMKPLCDENCLGLCAQCGANRNVEPCRCEVSPVDSRWGALQEIRDHLSKKRDI